MNPFGSYRKLLENSKQAMLAAIEIYNKPQFTYREEVFSILLINAWELLLLAMLSKNRQRIFQPKQRDKDYQTWQFPEALNKAKPYFPASVDYAVASNNLFLLKDYRNKAVHYYNHDQTAHCIYVLAQAAIKNYRDVVNEAFDQDIVSQINLVLLPLSFNEQPDFVEFFKGVKKADRSPLTEELFKVLSELEQQQADTTRLLTQCTVKLESTKKITSADIVVGIDNTAANTVVLPPPQDPNKSHPYGRTSLLSKLKSDGHPLKVGEFESVCWKYELKNTEKHGHKYAWKLNTPGASWRFTSEVLKFIKTLTPENIETAQSEHRNRNQVQQEEAA